MKCPKCQYIGFDGHTRCRHCGYDLSLSATTESDAGRRTDMPFDAAPDVPDTIYRPEPSARAQARAAIQKRAASRTPQPESFDLPLFATPGVDDRPALPASRPPLSVRRAADSPRAAGGGCRRLRSGGVRARRVGGVRGDRPGRR